MSDLANRNGGLFGTIDACPGYRFYVGGNVESCWKGGRYPCMTEDWWLMTTSVKSHGFLDVSVRVNGVMTRVYVHNMLCWAYHGMRPAGHECLFRDSDRGNLSPDNLFWGISPENVMSPDVEFRSLPDSEGYLFGSDGSVFSCWESGCDSPTDVWKRLALSLHKSGHLHCRVKIGDKLVSFGVHQLICRAWHGDCPEGLECLHEDGVATNNTPGNLRWGTRLENIRDQFRHGVFARGETQGLAVLTENIVRQAREDYEAGRFSGRRLAKIHGVSWGAMRQALNRETWTHVA